MDIKDIQPTHIKYKDPEGIHPFSAERTVLQEKIITRIFLDAEKDLRSRKLSEEYHAPEKPVLMIIGGGPGSGKSALTRWLRKNHVLGEGFVSLTLQSFSQLPEFQQIAQAIKHPHPEKHEILAEEYYHLRQKVLEECIKRGGVSLTIDDHCNRFEEDKKLVQTAKEAGFTTVMVGMCITPAGYFANLRSIGGVDQHTPWALEMHKQFARRWEEIASLFENGFLYQKTDSHKRPLALISQCLLYNNGELNQGIIDGERYARFKQWEQVITTGKDVREAFPPGKDEEDEYYRRRVGAVRKGGFNGGEEDTPKQGNGVRGFLQKLTRSSHKAISLE